MYLHVQRAQKTQGTYRKKTPNKIVFIVDVSRYILNVSQQPIQARISTNNERGKN